MRSSPSSSAPASRSTSSRSAVEPRGRLRGAHQASRRMRLALAHARAETRQLAALSRRTACRRSVPGARCSSSSGAIRARRARAAPRRLRGDGAADGRVLPVRGRHRCRPDDALGVVPADAARLASARGSRGRVLSALVFAAATAGSRGRRRGHRLRRAAVAPGGSVVARRRPLGRLRPVRAARHRARILAPPPRAAVPVANLALPPARDRRVLLDASDGGDPARRRPRLAAAADAQLDGDPRLDRDRRQPAARATTSRRSPPGRVVFFGARRGGATAATRASGSAERYQTERRSPATSSALAGPRIRLRAGALHDRLRDLVELRLRDPEVPQAARSRRAARAPRPAPARRRCRAPRRTARPPRAPPRR